MPRDVIPPGPSLVPFVCKSEYDGGPFLTYSARPGLSNSVAHKILTDLVNAGSASLIPLAELESVVQTWLFFGLLTEVLGILFKPSEYVQSVAASNSLGGQDKVMDTSKLVPTVTLWMQQVHEAATTKEESRRQHQHIVKCLRLVGKALCAVEYRRWPSFNPLITWSIASVGELLSEATKYVFAIDNDPRGNRSRATWARFYDSPDCTGQMRRGGCCPSEIDRIRNLGLRIQTYHLLLWMDRSEPSAQHLSCTHDKCRANQINLSQYTTKHRHDRCQCSEFRVDLEEVIRILSQGVLPLLRIELAPYFEDLRIDVVEAKATSNDVAISHIWADGLRNPYANALPRCQLQHLYQIVRSLLENQTNKNPGEVVFLWIDTLCCPVEPAEAKKMALNQMKTPYSEASHVLVLDSSLQRVDLLGLAPEEICMRIFTSGWMRRLWTLQEGALPRNLWFQFKYVAVNLDSVFHEVFDKIHKIDISRSALLLDICRLRGGLRGFFHAEENIPSADIVSVHDALRFRSVSLPTDEALLIGGLLNLDLAHILDGPAESRMQRVWTLVSLAPGGIPKNVIFNRGPRLRQMGFRWAPQSLLSSRRRLLPFLRSHEGYNTCRLTSTGLEVRVSAFSTAIMASAPRGAPKNLWDVFNDFGENHILCRYYQGLWFIMKYKYGETDKAESNRDGASRRASLHTLLKDASQTRRLLLASAFEFEAGPEVSDALLVHSVTGPPSSGPRQVFSDTIVQITKLDHFDQVHFEAAFRASRSLLDDEITAQYPDLAVEDDKGQRQTPVYADLRLRLEVKINALAESLDFRSLLSIRSEEEIQSLKRLTESFISYFYFGDYCILGPMLSSETEWCVD